MNILVTGGCGFIGSNFVRYYLKEHPNDNILVFDKLTYAGKLGYIEDLVDGDRLRFYCLDIAREHDLPLIKMAAANHHVEAIINFAAETHVDNSIKSAYPFVYSNVIGGYNMVETAHELDIPRMVQISTDEVYGSLEDNDKFREDTPLDPSSPYSSTKTGADLIALSYFKTHKVPVCITRCSNNYGPRQHEEKLIPTLLKKYWAGEKFPIYGKGKNIRDWIYVEDHCRAIDNVLHNGAAGEVYNVGGNCELTNLELVYQLLLALNEGDTKKACKEYDERISFVEDRKGHDYRYAIDYSKIESDLGWYPQTSLQRGLSETIDWYKEKWNV